VLIIDGQTNEPLVMVRVCTSKIESRRVSHMIRRR
jgi:hypothetical protein